MKVILSRKGMDSEAGGIPSPILPDGTLLSLPIPDNTSGQKYSELYYNGQSLQEIIHQLKPRFNFSKNPTCHLDPDIYNTITNKPTTWKPAFGQWDIPAAHLDKLDVDIGDIFLFYGMFQQTRLQADGTLAFNKGSPIRHIIYGYMRVGDILRDEQKITDFYPWHPHSNNTNHANNRLYLPAEYGTFRYTETLVLTQSGQNNRSLWQLPPFFAQKSISISWQGNNHPVLKNGFSLLNSSARGQEFIITADTEKQENNLHKWVENMIQIGKGQTGGYQMEQLVTEIYNADLKKDVFKNVQFIFFAESGAMGESGKVLIVTSGGSIFHCNYCYGDISLTKLFCSIPVLKECDFSTLGENAKIPNGWNYEYLGSGNHLLIRNDAFEDFKGKTKDAEYPEDMYMLWFNAAWDIIQQHNMGKLPIETKTPAELALLCDSALHSTKALSEEERIIDDLEHGYDPFEDERVIITAELVHGNDMPDGTIETNEECFSDYRSYMSELWYWEHTTLVTYYFPVDDPLTGHIPNDNKFIESYLIFHGKLSENEEHHMETMILNRNGIDIYSVTITIACEDDEYCEARL